MSSKAPSLLDQLDQTTVGLPPLHQVVQAGRAAKRRQRRILLSGAIGAVGLIVGTGTVVIQALGDSGGDGSRIASETRAPTPPVGTRFVGIGQAVVAIPNHWASQAESCNSPVRDTYFFPHPQDCLARHHDGVSSVAITAETIDLPVGTSARWLTPDGEVDGHKVVATKIECPIGQGESCWQLFGIPDLAAFFEVTIPEYENATTEIAAIRDSLTVLPEGRTTVPFVQVGTDWAVRGALANAGLNVRIERVPCPAYAFCTGQSVVGMSPEPGMVVDVGATVTATIEGG